MGELNKSNSASPVCYIELSSKNIKPSLGKLSVNFLLREWACKIPRLKSLSEWYLWHLQLK